MTNPRGTECKTGQASRDRHKRLILERDGAWCWICLARGRGARARINLRLRWPHPRCFTRDHVLPRSLGGTDDIDNLRGAHNWCNTSRGAKEVLGGGIRQPQGAGGGPGQQAVGAPAWPGLHGCTWV